MQNYKKHFGLVAVLYGGDSNEREISLLSAQMVMNALDEANIDYIAIDSNDLMFIEKLKTNKFKRCFIALHGGDGENGCIQALLEILKIPYTGSNVLASAIGFNKIMAKNIWKNHGLSTPKYINMKHGSQEININFPIAIKPISSGSSIGITKAERNDIDLIKKAYESALLHGEVMAEEWIDGKEYAVTVIDDEIFPSIYVEPSNEYYDYSSKYIKPSKYFCPSGIELKDELKIKDIAKKAYDAIGCSGCARIDFIRCNKSHKFYILEANTVPGFTKNSLVPKAAKTYGLSFKDLIIKILEKTI